MQYNNKGKNKKRLNFLPLAALFAVVACIVGMGFATWKLILAQDKDLYEKFHPMAESGKALEKKITEMHPVYIEALQDLANNGETQRESTIISNTNAIVDDVFNQVTELVEYGVVPHDVYEGLQSLMIFIKEKGIDVHVEYIVSEGEMYTIDSYILYFSENVYSDIGYISVGFERETEKLLLFTVNSVFLWETVIDEGNMHAYLNWLEAEWLDWEINPSGYTMDGHYAYCADYNAMAQIISFENFFRMYVDFYDFYITEGMLMEGEAMEDEEALNAEAVYKP